MDVRPSRVVEGGSLTITAIEDVYRRQYSSFLRVARAMLGGHEPARDAVQEAFARAIAGRSSYRAEGSLEAWLWRTLVNVCADERRRRPQPLGLASENGLAEEWPELRAAIAALPERQRVVLFLRHYADLDYEAIGEALRIRPGTVAATLHAARKKLRRTLAGVVTP